MGARRRILGIAAALALFLGFACAREGRSGPVLRVGHFPNVTHAQALVARALAREGRGWFEERLGPGVALEWLAYNAGPSAMEAILTGSLDLTYVGPSPAIHLHLKSKGAEVRLVAPAIRGGSALVVRGDGAIRDAKDLRGRRIATPQLGNTQDVACRAWLRRHGLRVSLTGGDVLVIPTQNPDQIPLFERGEIDGAWTVEPWVSRLELEAGGRVLLEDRESLTTVLAASTRALREKREFVRRFVEAHAELGRWIEANPNEAKRLLAVELAAETTRSPKPALIDRCFERLRIAGTFAPAELEGFVASAREAGFLADAGSLAALVEIPQ
jgi:sulfonate transport system substrate-binding protein